MHKPPSQNDLLGGGGSKLEIAILQHPEIRPRLSPRFRREPFLRVACSGTVPPLPGTCLAKLHRSQRPPTLAPFL